MDNHCSREMFALTMLVRLGKVTEQDILSTYALFQKLDKNNEGILAAMDMSARSNRDMSTILPRQRYRQPTDSSELTESSALLHPLANKEEDHRTNYMSAPKRGEMTPKPLGLLNKRGMSLESLFSNMTEENWEYNS